MKKKITIIGGGLSGCEAAWQLLKRGFNVHLIEQRPLFSTGAHKTGNLAELVCSNSFRSDDPLRNAIGLLHEEMRACDSLIMKAADFCKVPAGGALAVDRENFSNYITQHLLDHSDFTLEYAQASFPKNNEEETIIATGPLSSDNITQELSKYTGEKLLHFFDALAPIVYTDSIDMTKAWYQSRYDKGDGTDYLNCPLTKEEYTLFYNTLIKAETVAFKEYENKKMAYFEGCLPIEVMASRGFKTLLFGPMKPTGLSNPFEDFRRPFAVLQLRKENITGTLMNLVGFQTKLTYPEQQRVFRLIPALKNAEFARLGAIHRNTFVCGPDVLTPKLSLKNKKNIKLAGQITGCEGYLESTAIGFLSAIFTALPDIPLPPKETALGALLGHVTESKSPNFQPMNVNFGLFPELEDNASQNRKEALVKRARLCLSEWLEHIKI